MHRPRPSSVAKATFFVILAGATLAAGGAEAPSPPPSEAPSDPWQPFAVFLGSWQGEEVGIFGRGAGERSYRMILQGRYLLAENHSVFPPQEGLPEGEDHEDWAVFGYDRSRATYVIRQFTSEGYVNRYILDPSSEVPERMVFVSEASENAPPGLRTRLSYELLGDDEFTEVFEIAPPGKDFGVVIRNRWRRVGGPPSEPPPPPAAHPE